MTSPLPPLHDAPVILASAAIVYLALVAVARVLRRWWGVGFGAPFHLLALALGLLAGIGASPWHTPAAEAVRRHLGAIALILAAFPITTIANRLLWRRARPGAGPRSDAPRVLADATGIVIALIAAVIVLQYVYDVRVPGLLAGSGLVAIILGLALQDLLGNLFAGIALYLQKPFATGDWLLVDGAHAKVIEVSWRSTRLITTDDVLIDVPNSEIVKHTITNFENPTPRHAVRATIPLHDEVPPARAQEVLRRAAATVDGICADPEPVVYLKEFGDSSASYEIKVWIESHAIFSRVLSDLRSHCWYAVRRAGLESPFPTIVMRRPAPNRVVERARATAARTLREHPIFGFLSAEQIDALVEESRVVLFSPSEHVVEQDAAGQSMFLLVSGRVDVRLRRDGHTSAVAQLGPGDCFGELSALTGEPRSATVVALEELEAVEITKSAVASLVAANPEVLGRLSELLAQRQRANEEQPHWDAATDTAATSPAGMLRRLRGFFQLGV